MTKKITIIFISLVTLLAVTGIGVYLFSAKKSPALPQTPAKKLTEIKVASWKTYQNKDFSFEYPADWKIATQESQISIGAIKVENISNVILPTINPNSSGSALAIQPPEGGSITIQTMSAASQGAQLFPSTIFSSSVKIELGKAEVQTYVLKNHGALVNYRAFAYETKTSLHLLSLDYYNYQHPDWNYPALFDQIIKSFK